jgi:hypothetical protein
MQAIVPAWLRLARQAVIFLTCCGKKRKLPWVVKNLHGKRARRMGAGLVHLRATEDRRLIQRNRSRDRVPRVDRTAPPRIP